MTQRRSLATLAATLALVACGGGGGGSEAAPTPTPPPPPPASYTLSGTITVAETAAVDSDTNDVNQADYVPNDTTATAQALVAPVLLVGSANKPNTGPRGRNNNGTTTLGDQDDIFRVNLVAGQVVELEFATDASQADLDLYLYKSDGTLVGRSDGVASRFECISVNTAGSYYVLVRAFAQASIYNLRIGAPGTSASCPQQAAALAFDPTQLVAEPKRGDAGALGKAQALLEEAGASLAKAATNGGVAKLSSGQGPQLLRLPSGDLELAQGLLKLQRTEQAGAKPAQATRGKGAGAAGAEGTATGWTSYEQTKLAQAQSSPLPAAIQTLIYAKTLRQSGAFEYVEPNELAQTTALVGNFPPNDRFYSYQRWHYEQINLPAAMQRIVGLNLPATQRRPLVAVIDDGVVINHPDLAPQLFSNGRSFISTNSEGDGDRATADSTATRADQPVFHGSHVSGTVLAATFDGVAGAGVAPMAQLLPLRVFPARGGGASLLDIIQAMRYSAGLSNRSGSVPARRADVVNMSLGAASSCGGAYQTAVNDLRAAGVVVVVAAGNDGRNNQGVRAPVGAPANCPGAIAVSATQAQSRIAPYSNTGTQIVLAAPGGDTSVSTTGTGSPDGVYSAVGTFDAAGSRQPSFAAMQGTSMASPHVAGVMALMFYVNPNLTVSQIDSLIASGAISDDIGSAGRDIDFGYGLVNARKAVDAALGALTTPPPAANAPVVAQPSALDLGAFQSTATLDLAAVGTSTEAVSGAVQVILPTGMAAGSLTVAATAVDARGLGRYTVTVNRTALANGSYFPVVRFTLNTGRVINVQLSVQKQAGTTSNGNFGAVYVLLIDPATDTVVDTVLATRVNGRYQWSKSGYTRPKVAVLAGTDLDNDDFLCARGEACGAFPVLSPGFEYTSITLTGNRTDLNFEIVPTGAMSAAASVSSATPGASAAPVGQGLKRGAPFASTRAPLASSLPQGRLSSLGQPLTQIQP